MADNPRNTCLFTLGINTNLRAGDILNIKVGQVRGSKELVLKEKKTGKTRRITLNKVVMEAVKVLLESREYSDSDYLFLGQRGPLTVPTLSRMVKGWCKAVNLKGNYGGLTLYERPGVTTRGSLTVWVCRN